MFTSLREPVSSPYLPGAKSCPSGKRLPSLPSGSRGGTLPFYSHLLHDTPLGKHSETTQLCYPLSFPPNPLSLPHWPSETFQSPHELGHFWVNSHLPAALALTPFCLVR